MSFSSIFHAITHGTYDFLVRTFSKPAMEKVDADVKQILSEDFLPIFKEAVQEVANLPGEGAEKRAAAFAKIVDELKVAGKSLPSQVINLGIELVLGLLKGKASA